MLPQAPVSLSQSAAWPAMSGLSGLPAMSACFELLLPRPLQCCAVETQAGGRVDVGSRPQRPR